MTDLDLLILTVYIITVVYVLYQAINTLDDQTTFHFDRNELDRVLEEQELKDVISLNFRFEDRYKFEEQPTKLSLSLENKSADRSFEVDWDHSSLTDFEGRSRRAIRLTPDKRFNLPGYLAFSTVPPGKTLKEDFTAEDTLKMNIDGSLESASPIVDILGIEAGSKKPNKRGEQLKKLYANFMERKEDLRFSARIIVKMSDLVDGGKGDRTYVLPCNFVIKKVPWSDALPFNPKK
ncbi:MAG: hypothetical protein HC833_03715 [Leptolyngbyaceae cyanobacterium RM1_406_9]|nr:hypothetical protein [Leptolyngbyaceae cyanobacterium RM1_406_9]